jgi:putative transposase
MSQAYSIATKKHYGLQRVCRVWDLPRSTVYARRDPQKTGQVNKPGPMGPCNDATLVKHIGQVLAASPFHGEGYRKVWAQLRFNGIRTSKERVRRLMRENGLQAFNAPAIPTAPKPTMARLLPISLTRCGAPMPQPRSLGKRTWPMSLSATITVPLNVPTSIPRLEAPASRP